MYQAVAFRSSVGLLNPLSLPLMTSSDRQSQPLIIPSERILCTLPLLPRSLIGTFRGSLDDSEVLDLPPNSDGFHAIAWWLRSGSRTSYHPR